MKKVSVIPLLVALCFLLIGLSVFTLIEPLFGYNPLKYVTLGAYKGLEYQKLEKEITAEEIEYAMGVVVAGFATQSEETKDAQTGDTLTVDYVGTVGGKQVETFTDKGREITLGKNEFIVPGADDFLVGANKGQTVNITLTVPETYHVEEFIGKQVTFSVTVQKITRTNIPELTDEFVKQLGNYTTVAQFKKQFEAEYRQAKAEEAASLVRNDLFQMAVDNATVKGYPKKPLEELKLELKNKVQAGATEMGMEFYEYASFAYGCNSKQEYEEYETTYAKNVLDSQMVLGAIAKTEGITVTDEEYNRLYTQYLEAFKAEDYTEEYMVEYYGGEDGLKEQFLLELVTDFIEENAIVSQ